MLAFAATVRQRPSAGAYGPFPYLEHGTIMEASSSKPKRVFDCTIFRDPELLAIRLKELDPIVDYFVIVERLRTSESGAAIVSFNPNDPRLVPFAAKFRHVIVADEADEDRGSTRAREQDAILRGVPDAVDDDLITFSRAEEVPKRSALTAAIQHGCANVLAFRLASRADERRQIGQHARQPSHEVGTIAASALIMRSVGPSALRSSVHDGQSAAHLLENGGWLFAEQDEETPPGSPNDRQHDGARAVLLALLAGAKRKWKAVGEALSTAFVSQLPNREPIGTPRPNPSRPVVICPYLYDQEADQVIQKFALDTPACSHIEYYLWQDAQRIGPELAFERCWDRFPGRDIIIIHSDMAPPHGEPPERWFDELCRWNDALPDAGMVACNLLFPALPDQPVTVQCAGGTLNEGVVSHLHGPLGDGHGSGGYITADLLRRIRPVDWVTFGGVLIRRNVINACGRFDRRYRWAYVGDVDYSCEARLRGFRLYQVPVTLIHEESRTTRKVMEQHPELRTLDENLARFYEKWAPFRKAMPTWAEIGQASGAV